MRVVELSRADVLGVKKKWDDLVLPKNLDLEAIYIDEYRWHIFSYNKVAHLAFEKANCAFMKVKKNDIYIVYQHSDKGYRLEGCYGLKISEISQYINSFDDMDIYLVDTNYKWSYVKTHEEPDIGPFFIEIIKQ